MAWSLEEGSVLGLFARRPVPGQVKTRLAASIGDGPAAELYEAMLLDQLDLWGSDRILAPGGRRVVVFDPPDSGPWFDGRAPAGLALQPQAPGDLGARMAAFFAGEFADGARKVVLIGTDTPTLDPSFILSAFLLLDGKDAVLGPAPDGGYYLIGLRSPRPGLFEGVEWGTPRVLDGTVARAEALGLSLAVLPPWYDVDTPEDLAALRGHLRAMRAAGTPTSWGRTERRLL